MNIRRFNGWILLIVLALLSGCGKTATPSPPPPTATPEPSPTPAAETLKIRVTQFPPQYYLNAAGEWTGLDAELARALVEAAGLTPEFVDLPWSRALQEMESGELHIMMNLSQTEERSAYMHWIGPERFARMVLVVQPDNLALPIQTLDDLTVVAAERNVWYGIQQDAFYSEEFNARLENDAEFARWFEAVTEARLNPRKTLSGRIVGFFEDGDAVAYKLTHDPEYAGLAVHTFVLSESPVYFGVSRAGVSAEILEKLQQAYTRLEQDGTFERIRQTAWK